MLTFKVEPYSGADFVVYLQADAGRSLFLAFDDVNDATQAADFFNKLSRAHGYSPVDPADSEPTAR
jgi:hypothetical protein